MARTPQVFRYRIHTWRSYKQALINRGHLTVWFDEDAIVGERAARNNILQQIAGQRRLAWRALRGCTRQSIAENTMFRFKRLFGG